MKSEAVIHICISFYLPCYLHKMYNFHEVSIFDTKSPSYTPPFPSLNFSSLLPFLLHSATLSKVLTRLNSTKMIQ